MLRITGGRFRGRKLASLRGREVRPSSARLREAVFNILGDVEGLNGVDLFCGAGTMGFEALSRGAASVTFVDWSVASLRAVRSNIALLGVESETEVIRADLTRRFPAPPAACPLGWIYADPPWPYWERLGTHRAIGDRLVEISRALGEETPLHILVEHGTRQLPFEGDQRLTRLDTRSFGEASLTFVSVRDLGPAGAPPIPPN